MPTLKDKIAVVTGASSGIGKAIALGLAGRDVNVCIVGRNIKTLHSVANTINTIKSQIACYRADLTLDEDIQKLKDSLLNEYDKIDILVHSAGVISIGALASSSIEDLDLQYRTNVRSPYLLTQTLLPIIRLESGQIVFINSSVVKNIKANIGQYASTKCALKGFVDSFRQEINPKGIRVLSVFPGRTASPMQESIFSMEGRKYNSGLLLQPTDIADVVINALKLPSSAEVTDIEIRPFKKSE